ncbi:hypothetical protein D3C87_1612540 [compost metagenome]
MRIWNLEIPELNFRIRGCDFFIRIVVHAEQNIHFTAIRDGAVHIHAVSFVCRALTDGLNQIPFQYVGNQPVV